MLLPQRLAPVFRQGDDAINWYALLEGSVDVRVAQSGSSSAKVSSASSTESDRCESCLSRVAGLKFVCAIVKNKNNNKQVQLAGQQARVHASWQAS